MPTRRFILPIFFFPLVVRNAPARAEPKSSAWDRVFVAAAESQIGRTTIYDPSYVRLAFPGGDIPLERGVCTDVIIRAYRALGFDLQRAVHEDKKRAGEQYPTRWGRMPPDSNIDHRRVPNLQVFFRRQRAELLVPSNGAEWQPGDLVTQMLPGNLPHIGVCARERDTAGVPLVIHNIGRGTQKEPLLMRFPITGRFRFEPPRMLT